jgi:hypothetical protein
MQGMVTGHLSIPTIPQNIDARIRAPRSRHSQPAFYPRRESSPRDVHLLTHTRPPRATNPRIPQLPHHHRNNTHNRRHPRPHPGSIQASEPFAEHTARRKEETTRDTLLGISGCLLHHCNGLEVCRRRSQGGSCGYASWWVRGGAEEMARRR